MNDKTEQVRLLSDGADAVWQWITANIRTLDAVNGITDFPDYAYLRDLVREMCRNRILLVAKSRQMLATWTVAAVTLFRAITGAPGLYLFLSKGARDSRELIRRLKFMAGQTPEKDVEVVRATSEEIEFTTGSRILSLPATEEAPRMHSPAGVFWDEMAFTRHSEAIWTAVKPAVDAGGWFVGVSTPNGTDNEFFRLYSDGGNGFGKVRLHYRNHPARDNAWETTARRGLSANRWKQEYEIDFSVLTDRVYTEFDASTHVINGKFDWKQRKGRLYRGLDFGYRHPYAIWAMMYPTGEMVVFDEWEGEDATVEEIAEQLRAIDAKHGISETDVTFTACDPAGAGVTDEGLSPVERLRRKGFRLVYRRSEIATGVELVKTMLKDAGGRVWLKFAPEAKRTLEHLMHYRWKGGSSLPFKDDVHDHAMDALRYLIVNVASPRKVNWSGARVTGTAR